VIADRVGVAVNTVGLIANRFVESDGDVEATISRKQRLVTPVPAMVAGEVEARLIALACSAPAGGMRACRCGCRRSTSRLIEESLSSLLFVSYRRRVRCRTSVSGNPYP